MLRIYKIIIRLFALLPLVLCAQTGNYSTDTARINKLYLEARGYIDAGDHQKLSENVNQAILLCLSAGFDEGLAKNYRLKGLYFDKLGQRDSSVTYYELALEIFEELGNSKFISLTHHTLGFVYYSIGSYEKSLEYYLKAVKIREADHDTVGLAWSQNNIGLIYWKQKSPEEALRHFLIAEKLFAIINNKPGLATTLGNVGLIYSMQDQFDKTLAYYFKALKIHEETGNKFGAGMMLNNIGSIYMAQKSWDKALDYFQKSYVFHLANENLEMLGLNLSNLSLVSIEKGNAKEALQYAFNSLEYYKKAKAPDGIKEAYRHIAQSYAALKKYEDAYSYHVMYSNLNDSLSFGTKLSDMETKFEREKTEKEMELLKKEKTIQAERLKKDRAIITAGIIGSFLLVLLALLIWRNLLQRKKAHQTLEIKNTEIVRQKEIIEEKSKDITDSIQYAKRIQEAILPPMNEIKKAFPNSFVLYTPRDIVSGDFYWYAEINNKHVIALADCTGHGVPGAFMSIIGHDTLNHVVRDRQILLPKSSLEEIDYELSGILNKKGNAEHHDGMDMSLCVFDFAVNKLFYSGAHRSLLLVREGNLIEYVASKYSLGGIPGEQKKSFTIHEIDIKKGDVFYLFSDGYADQFGGPEGKKYKQKRLKTSLLNNSQMSLQDQHDTLLATHLSWKGDADQVDDICIIGIKIT